MVSFISCWTIPRIGLIFGRTDSTPLFITKIMAMIYHHKCTVTVWKMGDGISTIPDWLYGVMLQIHAL